MKTRMIATAPERRISAPLEVAKEAASTVLKVEPHSDKYLSSETAKRFGYRLGSWEYSVAVDDQTTARIRVACDLMRADLHSHCTTEIETTDPSHFADPSKIQGMAAQLTDQVVAEARRLDGASLG